MIKKYFDKNIKRNFSIASIWIKGGSVIDSENKKGINQILCSLLTKGCEGFDNLALSDFIESYGGELNNEIFEDGMLISLKSLNSNFDKLIPLIDLIINKPILSEIQFQKVKTSTINLIKKDKENSFNICFDKWKKIVYSKHPYAFNTIGYEKDVSQIVYTDVLSEYEKFRSRKKFLISNNIRINGECLEVLNKKVSKEELNIPSKKYLSQESRFASSHNESNQIIMMIGNQTCSRKSSEYLHLKLLEAHLSYGMSSLLFKLFREKHGITYEIGVYNPVREEKAPFLIYLSVSNKNAILAFELLSALWNDLMSSLITDQEISLAKNKLKSSFLLSNQSLDEILQRKIQLISYGISPNLDRDYSSKIENISSKVIQELTNKYFAKPFFSIIGDKKICLKIKNKWINNF